ncbi:ABC transporter permease [Pyrodictium occultum]|uniref:ABC transporter permease n=1 Tax=Pyrodictium occultum TaxID=2309 RepID=UPI000A4354C0|nr:ABC transporter permease [Pyrodictium occultum]
MSASRARRVERLLLVFAAFSSLGMLFILAPLAALLVSVDPGTFAKVWLRDTPYARQAYPALLRTLEASLVSSTLLLVIGIPLGYLLARSEFPGKRLVEALVDVPLVIPHAVAGIMILLAYGRRGLLGGLAAALGLQVENGFWGIVASMMFVSFPLMVDVLKLGYERVGASLELVARSLGASPWMVFRRVTLPLILPHIAAGFLLSWARAMSEVGAILIVAYYPKTINVLIYEWFNNYGLRYAVALSAFVVLLSIAAFTAIRVLTRHDHGA